MKFIKTYLIIVLILGCNACVETPEYQSDNSSDNRNNIELNGGKKWKVDDNMVVYIRNMDQLINDYASKPVNSYPELGKKLMYEVNSLTSSCNMTGKSHDELHKWLLPFIDLVDALKNAENEKDQRQLYIKLKTSMDEYHRYFE